MDRIDKLLVISANTFVAEMTKGLCILYKEVIVHTIATDLG